MAGMAVFFPSTSVGRNGPIGFDSNENVKKTQHSATYGGTLATGTANPPVAINPIITQSSVSASLMELIFDPLLRKDSQGNIVPVLAESWEVSDSGLEYTFLLKKGVRFHDGVELTAEDVKFTYESIKDPKLKSPWKTSIEIIEKYEVVDRYKIKITFKHSGKQILNKLSREIVPKHVFLDQEKFNSFPIGTGPFKFEYWNKQINEIKLFANDEYFDGRPYLDQIIVKTYKNNAELWSALMRHEIDFVKFINYENYLILKKDPSFKTYKIPWKMYRAIAYNLNDYILSDEQVRKAISYGIDRQEIIDIASPGASQSLYPNGGGLNSSEYNPVRAKIDLMHRGWKDTDGDGILDKSRKKLEINLKVFSNAESDRKIASILRQQLAEIGIKLNVELFEYNLHSKNSEESYMDSDDQAWLRYFVGPSFNNSVRARNWYSPSTEFGNLWINKNPDLDHLFEDAKHVETEEEREKAYEKINAYAHKHQLACFLYLPVGFHAVSSRFGNTDSFFTSQMPDYTLKNWYLMQN